MIDAPAELYVTRKQPRDVRVLEIGSWVGTSAIAWGKILERLGITKYLIYCCDVWYHHKVVPLGTGHTTIGNWPDSFNHELFRFNIQKSIGLHHVVEVIGDSTVTLNGLRDGPFDLVYVDGYHGYDVASMDMLSAIRLCRNGGIICGDDYDCTSEMIERLPIDRLNDDGQILDGWDWGLHAGLSKAVDDILGVPLPFGTFWAFTKEDKLTPLDVATLPRRVPAFIPDNLQNWTNMLFAMPYGLPEGHPFVATRHL